MCNAWDLFQMREAIIEKKIRTRIDFISSKAACYHCTVHVYTVHIIIFIGYRHGCGGTQHRMNRIINENYSQTSIKW